MPESAKECDTVLPEGLDIGLGPGDRAFEPHYSDQNPSEINDFRGIFLSLITAVQNLSCHYKSSIYTSLFIALI